MPEARSLYPRPKLKAQSPKYPVQRGLACETWQPSTRYWGGPGVLQGRFLGQTIPRNAASKQLT